MAGINTGILINAYPLTTEQIKALEERALITKETFAYLDDTGKVCFTSTVNPESVKDFAWHNAYELISKNNILTKKVYIKQSKDTFRLEKLYKKTSIEDAWEQISTEGNASGSIISLSDVSPIEHTLKVKLEAPEGIDVQNVKLKTSGKNMFDPELITNFTCSSIEADGSIKLTNPTGTIINSQTRIYVNSKEPVTLSYEYKNEKEQPTTSGLRFRAHYKETSSEPYIGAAGVLDYTKVTFTSEEDLTLEYFYTECGTSNTTWIKNIQLEFGSQTEYEPYAGAEYMPNSDGTVDGVKSISPNMVLSTDTYGVVIDVEYNRDISSFVDDTPVLEPEDDVALTIHIKNLNEYAQNNVVLRIDGAEVYRTDNDGSGQSSLDVQTFEYSTMPSSAYIAIETGSEAEIHLGTSWTDLTSNWYFNEDTIDLLALGYTDIYIGISY